jgi:hypothetical protein
MFYGLILEMCESLYNRLSSLIDTMYSFDKYTYIKARVINVTKFNAAIER